jgi:hypothetical protein
MDKIFHAQLLTTVLLPGILMTFMDLAGTEKLFLRSKAPGLVFSDDLSTGEFCPLRIPFDRLRAAVSPMDKS